MKRFWIIFIIVNSQGCAFDFPQEKLDEASQLNLALDFSNVAVLGGSQATGYMDGSLYNESQEASYPNLIIKAINEQLKDEQITFLQPDIQLEDGFDGDPNNPTGRFKMLYPAPDWDIFFKLPTDGAIPDQYNRSIGLHNFSVPGIKVLDITNTQFNNTFFNRFRQFESTSLLDEIISVNPSLIIVDIGINDIMDYAKNGLRGQINLTETEIGEFDLTPLEIFRNELEEILNQLLESTTADILLLNIPDFTEFPYFKYYGHLARITASEAGSVGNQYSSFNFEVGKFSSITGIRRPPIAFFSDNGPLTWAVVVQDPLLADVILEDGSELPKIRQLEIGESVLWSLPDPPPPPGHRTWDLYTNRQEFLCY